MPFYSLKALPDQLCRQKGTRPVMNYDAVLLARILPYIFQTVQNGKLPVFSRKGKSFEFLPFVYGFQPFQNPGLPYGFGHYLNRGDILMGRK